MRFLDPFLQSLVRTERETEQTSETRSRIYSLYKLQFLALLHWRLYKMADSVSLSGLGKHQRQRK